ncbi:phosphodiesterase 6H, cGMP-specific, cone, gamma, isoform CRA_c [Rattus norvegicus]|uniref:Phosphodiesterase 6H, cGMP-specific, cone, gamma, isoform CRA_c n=1 Tax=Rattus norvegicus TaxID=10116 RepID=A6IMJ8_RAT|nr:phosphodiesterase 6H, cGMP-specific, cone, gamma, isoform CRA_c [Rattus norvegicus]
MQTVQCPSVSQLSELVLNCLMNFPALFTWTHPYSPTLTSLFFAMFCVLWFSLHTKCILCWLLFKSKICIRFLNFFL